MLSNPSRPGCRVAMSPASVDVGPASPTGSAPRPRNISNATNGPSNVSAMVRPKSSGGISHFTKGSDEDQKTAVKVGMFSSPLREVAFGLGTRWVARAPRVKQEPHHTLGVTSGETPTRSLSSCPSLDKVNSCQNFADSIQYSNPTPSTAAAERPQLRPHSRTFPQRLLSGTYTYYFSDRVLPGQKDLRLRPCFPRHREARCSLGIRQWRSRFVRSRLQRLRSGVRPVWRWQVLHHGDYRTRRAKTYLVSWHRTKSCSRIVREAFAFCKQANQWFGHPHA